MDKIGYPKLGRHSQGHTGLKEKVKGYQYARFRNEDFSLTEIKDMLAEWLLKHILESDMDIGEFVREQEKTKSNKALPSSKRSNMA